MCMNFYDLAETGGKTRKAELFGFILESKNICKVFRVQFTVVMSSSYENGKGRPISKLSRKQD